MLFGGFRLPSSGIPDASSMNTRCSCRLSRSRTGGKVPAFMPADRLKKILDVKAQEVARLLPKSEALRAAALAREDFRGFAARLDHGPDRLGLIAEVKKASPSAGVIAADFDPIAIAALYEAAGADCVSVLTDEQFFQGHLTYLTRIRKEIALPCLRKDFIIHEVQLYEACVAGADAVLLVVGSLEEAEIAQFSMLLPGHGARVTLPHGEMHDRLLALVERG